MKRHIKTTEDGSSTIYVPELNEHYHSIHGAIQESMHVFIEAGLKQLDRENIRIFEMGFGTGLNCLLTYLNTRDKTVDYISIEKYPVEEDISNQLNFVKELNLNKELFKKFEAMHNLNWDEKVKIDTDFTLTKVEADIKMYEHLGKYDLVYFDAFAPEVQPDLWTFEIFNKLFRSMSDGSVLTTYCAKGVVRRTLQKCGFEVERIPGPPGKRQMIRAMKVESSEFKH